MRVCLVSSIHPWMNPRLVKEADALTHAGHEVVVVTRRSDSWGDSQDLQLLHSRQWRVRAVNLMRDDPDGRIAWFAGACRSKLAHELYKIRPSLRLAAEAYYRGYAATVRLARDVHADLYIGHTQGGLAVAAAAANSLGVPYAFDCEDLLADEAADGLRDSTLRKMILALERAYIAGAAYVSATSRAMADHLTKAYGISEPRVIHNVFPRTQLAGVLPPRQRPRKKFTDLVWVSARIGPGRGLEDALAALTDLPSNVRLTVLGHMLPWYAPQFSAEAQRFGVADRVICGGFTPPDTLLSALATFDVGLCADPNTCLNRSFTITNKLFQCLQAGLAIAASDTPGHREVMRQTPALGFVYQPGDVASLVRGLNTYIADGNTLLAAQQAAWDAGQQKYNWDIEQKMFLEAVAAAAENRASEPVITVVAAESNNAAGGRS